MNKAFTSKVQNTDIYRRFFQEVETYQSNHYGAYNRLRLVAAYNALPDEVKKFLKPKSDRLNQLYRGADGLSPKPAISFSNLNTAKLFGTFIIPFRELKTYSGLIDTEKVYKLLTTFKMNYDIGDDEGEVIVLNPDWNDHLNDQSIEVYRQEADKIIEPPSDEEMQANMDKYDPNTFKLKTEEVLPNASVPPIVGDTRPASPLDEILNKFIEEELDNMVPVRHSSRFLYHATNIKNYQDVKDHGLFPMWGDTVRSAYGGYYDLDNKYNGDYNDDELSALPEFMQDGLIFFSDKPMLGYSQTMQQDFKFEEAVLCIVEKNDTIYHKIGDEEYTNSNGQRVTSIEYVPVYDLPLIIERGDWFSFESQKVKHVLTGKELFQFMKLNFPQLIKK